MTGARSCWFKAGDGVGGHPVGEGRDTARNGARGTLTVHAQPQPVTDRPLRPTIATMAGGAWVRYGAGVGSADGQRRRAEA